MLESELFVVGNVSPGRRRRSRGTHPEGEVAGTHLRWGKAMSVGANKGEPCNIPWPVCPFCTFPLVTSGDTSWCDHEGCFAAAGYKLTGVGFPSRERDPCPDAAVEEIRDHTGAGGWVCKGHAAHWRRSYKPPRSHYCIDRAGGELIQCPHLTGDGGFCRDATRASAPHSPCARLSTGD